ncbi:MAG: branched-chain amino acid transporter substrate-binding protein [Rhodospirillales bacterium]|nr:branched-chain amino acid transporter substrate-binding protein [Rhodospirillales bacterium]
MTGRMTRPALLMLAALAMLGAAPAFAGGTYGPGVSDTEIKLGQTMPYSGFASSVSSIGKGELAYFAKVNAEGGVNGRKITLISLDDGYSPPRTVEQTRRLVEQDNVLFIFGSLGTAPNAAIRKYLNGRKVPQLFINSGATEMANPELYPWTMKWMPSLRLEGRIYAQYILQDKPDAKIGVLYQNDDFGRDYLSGFIDGLGPDGETRILGKEAYETTDPTITSQLIKLRGRGVDTLFLITQGKFSVQGIRAGREQFGPDATLIVPTVATSMVGILQPAGLDNAKGVISASLTKNPADKSWANDPGYLGYLAFMKQYLPDADPADAGYSTGYTEAQAIIEVIKQCGDELTRENVMKQATSIRGMSLPMLIPGITVTTGPADYNPIKQMRLQRFDGEQWVLFGEPTGG